MNEKLPVVFTIKLVELVEAFDNVPVWVIFPVWIIFPLNVLLALLNVVAIEKVPENIAFPVIVLN